MQLTHPERAEFSLSGRFRQAIDDDGRQTLESEITEEAARQSGRSYSPTRFTLPWAALLPKPISRAARRDMTAAGVSGSQNLVGTANTAVVDALRPWSVALQGGMVVLPELRGNVTVLRCAGSAVGEWLTDELAPATETATAINSLSLTPKNAVVLVEASHQFQRQAPNLDDLLARDLRHTAAVMIDAAILAGTGTSGQPHGLAVTPGVISTSGASLGWAGVQAVLAGIADNAVSEDALRWVGAPGVREVLSSRAKLAGGSVPVWDGRTIAGFPAHATPAAAAGTLALGDWSQALLGLWGAGPEIQVNPYSGFTTGVIAYRMWVTLDVGFLFPEAFALIEDIT